MHRTERTLSRATDTITRARGRQQNIRTAVEVRAVCCGPRSWGKLPAAQHVTLQTMRRRLLQAAPAPARTHVATVREIFLSVCPRQRERRPRRRWRHRPNNPFVSKKSPSRQNRHTQHITHTHGSVSTRTCVRV